MNTELKNDLTDLKAFLQALDFEVDGRMIKTVEDCIKLAKLSYFEGRVKGGDQPNRTIAMVDRFRKGHELAKKLATDTHGPMPDVGGDDTPNDPWHCFYDGFMKAVHELGEQPAHPPKDQPKALTPLNDDEIHGIAWKMFPEISKEFNPHREVAIKAVQFARDNGYISPSTDTDKLIEAGDSAFALWLAEIKDDGFDESTRYNVAKAAWLAATSKDVGE